MILSCKAQHLILNNYDSSYCRFFAPDSFAFKNITYSRQYLMNDKGSDRYMVKKTNYLNYFPAFKDQVSVINLDIYNTHSGELIQSIKKNVDEAFVNEDFISTLIYGCCGSTDSGELSTIWSDSTFLKYDTKYFQIDIDQGRIRLFFGYSCHTKYPDTVKGTLYYIIATSRPVESKTYGDAYKYTYHVAGKVIFKLDPKSKYPEPMRIYNLSWGIHLIENRLDERKSQGLNYEKLDLWGGIPTLNNVNITPLQIKPRGDTLINISIPIVHGYLFGDSVHTERTIYIK